MNQAMIDKLKSVEMEVTVRFGQTDMPLREVASLGSGSMIELNRTVDEPVELLVNDFPFARGEVVVVDGYYSVKISEISSPDEASSVFLIDSLNEPNVEENWTPENAETDAAELFADETGADVIEPQDQQSQQHAETTAPENQESTANDGSLEEE